MANISWNSGAVTAFTEPTRAAALSLVRARALSPDQRTLLTVQTLGSRPRVIVIVLAPARPSRLKTISTPRERNPGCARRSRPASARKLLANSSKRHRRNVAPKAKKVSGGADPGFPLGHNLAHGARHRIGVDHSQVTRMT